MEYFSPSEFEFDKVFAQVGRIDNIADDPGMRGHYRLDLTLAKNPVVQDWAKGKLPGACMVNSDTLAIFSPITLWLSRLPVEYNRELSLHILLGLDPNKSDIRFVTVKDKIATCLANLATQIGVGFCYHFKTEDRWLRLIKDKIWTAGTSASVHLISNQFALTKLSDSQLIMILRKLSDTPVPDQAIIAKEEFDKINMSETCWDALSRIDDAVQVLMDEAKSRELDWEDDDVFLWC